MDPRHRLADILRRTETSIAVAESLTSGHLQANLGRVSGSSAYFLGGITAYNIAVKADLLGVDRTHAAEVDCVSQRVAREMAAGVQKLFSSDIGIATTGYAEPIIFEKHMFTDGVCIRCGSVEMVGGRSDSCEYTPHAWIGFNVLGIFWEYRSEEQHHPHERTKADRVAFQKYVAGDAINQLLEWFEFIQEPVSPSPLDVYPQLRRFGGGFF